MSVHDWDDVDPLTDLEEFAAQIAALDLVISIDNSTVHLAGALGISVWTLLPSAANWRWLLDRHDTPWYPTMRLFRQPEFGDWKSVIGDVACQLRGLIKSGSVHVTRVREDGIRENIDLQPGKPADNLDSVTQSEPPVSTAAETIREKQKYEKIWTHDSYRKVCFGLLDAEKVGLIDKLRDLEVRTILDAGCGSGKLMQKLICEHADEFDVHGFDISDNCLDPFFDDIKDEILTVGCLWEQNDFNKVYDAIICTDVMEHIPTERVPHVLKNLCRCTSKLCYLAIALFPDGFGPKLFGEPLYLTVREPQWWTEQIAMAGFKVVGHAVEKHPTGVNLWLHAFATRQDPEGNFQTAIGHVL